jgi:hypothetical protein
MASRRSRDEGNGREEGKRPEDPGLLSKRSDTFEGFYRHPGEPGGEWSGRHVRDAEEEGDVHRATPERHEPGGGERRAEYGGRAPRGAHAARPHEDNLPYPGPDPGFLGRDRPGYQDEPRESGLGLRHKEHVAQPSYAGVGPRGYKRPDARIWEDVCERLTADADVDASDITVDVSQGEVTLRGTVESRRVKRRAEDLAEDVSGVRDVHNHLRLP